MNQIRSVYIVEPIDQGWIIERLMRDVATVLTKVGIATRIGTGDDYQGEEVIFNSRYLTAISVPQAKINSLFITHIDDMNKESQFKATIKDFNSFVCMSPQDANFVAALKGSRTGVSGIELPTRDLKVRPTRLAIFSACYDDGRKNERWITEYFRDKSTTSKQNFVFCFMGWGWEKFCSTMGELEMNYEIYRYSRFTPGEYDLYKEVLAKMDALLYLGFDGGAMCVYDAISANIDVIAPNISYHQNLLESVSLFDDKAGFFGHLDRLDREITSRKEALQRRSIDAYAEQLLAHWNSLVQVTSIVPEQPTKVTPETKDKQTLDLFRSHYKKLSLSRIRSAIIRKIQSLLIG